MAKSTDPYQAIYSMMGRYLQQRAPFALEPNYVLIVAGYNSTAKTATCRRPSDAAGNTNGYTYRVANAIQSTIAPGQRVLATRWPTGHIITDILH